MLLLFQLFDDYLLLLEVNGPYGFMRLSIGQILCALVCLNLFIAGQCTSAGQEESLNHLQVWDSFVFIWAGPTLE